MIHVQIEQLLLSNVGFAVVLKSLEDNRSLPIVIGAAEAQAIAIIINKVELPRPLTHDLLKNLLDFLECRLTKIEIHKIEEGTFYANLVLDQAGKELKMDSRPSDAIALALRCNAQIYVSSEVMDAAGIVTPEQEEENPQNELEIANDNLHNISPLDKLKQDLAKAVEEERYEDAAKLRDEIQRLDRTHTDN